MLLAVPFQFHRRIVSDFFLRFVHLWIETTQVCPTKWICFLEPAPTEAGRLPEEIGNDYLFPAQVIEAIWNFEQYHLYDQNGLENVKDAVAAWRLDPRYSAEADDSDMVKLTRQAWYATRKLLEESMNELFELLRPPAAEDFAVTDKLAAVTLVTFYKVGSPTQFR